MNRKSIYSNILLIMLFCFGFVGKAFAAPENVTNLSAAAEKYIAVLNWTPAPNADYYTILNNGVKIDIQVTGTAGSQTVSNLSPSTNYAFTIITWFGGVQSTGVTINCRTKSLAIPFNKGENIALNKTCKASTEGRAAIGAVDNDSTTTRWESAATDAQWFYVDLLKSDTIKNVSILWEAAYAKEYKIDVSNDATNWKTMFATTSGNGDIDEIYMDTVVRYVRFTGIKRATNYGYSFFEFQVFRHAPAAKLTTILLLPANANIELGSSQQFTCTARDQYGKNFPLTPTWTVTGGGAITSTGLFTATTKGSPFYVKVTDSATGTVGRTEIAVSPKVEFSLLEPAAKAMISDTRKPTFKWNSFSGATKYELYVNITRTDYDWMAPGSLLDRYSKVGETTTTQLAIPTDLSDRWTYKWYVVATDGQNKQHYSETKQFSLYLPVVETVDDGVPIINGCRDMNKNGSIQDYENWRLPIETRINNLMSLMTLEEKAYQMFYNSQEFSLSGWAFGPINEGDSQRLQKVATATRMGIPYVTAGDCIHGYATTYPVQSTMAATRDLNLVYRCASIQRMEQVGVGFRGTLAPLAEVGTKVLYPRIQEGCGEDADFAAGMTRAMVCGLQGGPELNPGSVMVHTKHWPGEGAGGEGLIVYDAVTINYHMKPWYANKEAGAGGIMPGYAGSSFIDPGGPGAGDSPAIIRYLREVIGYDGVICTDWLPSPSWINSAAAGADVMGGSNPGAVGFNMANFITSVGEARINDAVHRILRTKFQLGIFEDPYGDPVGGQKNFHTAASHATVVEAARRAITLLKNNNVLPLQVKLKSGDELLVTGPRSNDTKSYSIWTSYFHGAAGAKTWFQGIQDRATKEGIKVVTTATANTKLAVVCVGETGYTHRTAWEGDKPYLHDAVLTDGGGTIFGYDTDISLLKEIKAKGIPIVVVYTMPRPYFLDWTNDNCDAIVIGYRPGDGAGEAMASVLFGDYLPEGKLPWQLPRSMDQVGGDTKETAKEQWDLPYDLGATSEERDIIRNLIAAGEHVPPVFGNPQYQYGFGMTNFGLIDATPPSDFSLLTPSDNSSTTTPPSLTWSASADPETNIKTYEVWLDNELVTQTTQTSYKLEFVKGSGKHTWFVVAENWAGKRKTSTNTLSFNISDTTKPTAFSLLSPSNNSTVTGNLTLVWEKSIDAGTGIDNYSVYINNTLIKQVKPASANDMGNIALNAIASASSNNGVMNASAAVDVDSTTTRWQATTNANEWIMFDLKDYFTITKVALKWETAYGKVYAIQTSFDGVNWANVYNEANSDGGSDICTISNAQGRYVRINCTAGGTGYGFSLWDVKIYGKSAIVYNVDSWPNGSYSWSVKAVDYAGNTTDAKAPFTFTITGVTENLAPVANGGGDLRTTLPVSNLILDGGLSFDPEGKPLTYLWEKISGGTVSLTNDKIAKANISGLTDGNYSFKLTVSDGVKMAVDTVNVTVFKDQFTPVEIVESEKISIVYSNKTIHIMGVPVDARYQIYNMSGVKLLEGNSNTIDVSNLTSGIFILRIDAGNYKFYYR